MKSSIWPRCWLGYYFVAFVTFGTFKWSFWNKTLKIKLKFAKTNQNSDLSKQGRPINSHQNNQTILITYCIFCIKPVGKPLLLQPTDKPPLCITNGKNHLNVVRAVLQFTIYRVFWLDIQMGGFPVGYRLGRFADLIPAWFDWFSKKKYFEAYFPYLHIF